MRRRTRRAGRLLIAVAGLHAGFGLWMGRHPLLAMAHEGFLNSVDPHLDRNLVFWFLVASPFLWMVGRFALWLASEGRRPPEWLGRDLLALGLVGGLLMPVSGFWLILPPAALLMLAARRPWGARGDAMRGMLMMAIVLAGCQLSHNRYARRTVHPDELAGRWTLTPDGWKDLREAGIPSDWVREQHVIELRANRTCAVRTVFGLPEGPIEHRSYESGCSWRLGRDTHQFLRLEMSPPVGHLQLYFAERKGKLVLWSLAADPGAWRYLEFAKDDARS